MGDPLEDWDSEGGFVPSEDDEIHYASYTVERAGDMVWLILASLQNSDVRVIGFDPKDAFSVDLALCSAGQDAYDPDHVEHRADETSSGPEVPEGDEVPPPSE